MWSQAISENLGGPLAWTAVHFVWEAALLALLALSMGRFLARISPAARYSVYCGLLLLMLIAPVLTAWQINRELDDPGPMVLASLRTPEAINAAPQPPQPAWVDRFAHTVRVVTPWIVGVWAVGVVLYALRQVVSWVWTSRAVQKTSHPLGRTWRHLRSIPQRLGIRRRVRMLRSSFVEVPATMGWRRPLVLLPGNLLGKLEPIEVEALTAHELAHIRRGDYAFNFVQSFVEQLLFFHPAVWWVSGKIREEREHCCDDIAARLVGDPDVYSRALLAVEKLRAQAPSPVVGVTGTKGSLLARIQRLTPLGNSPKRVGGGTAIAASVLAAGAGVLVLSQMLLGSLTARPTRGPQDVNRVGAATYALLQVKGNADFIVPLDEVIAYMDNNKSLEDAPIDDLVDALNHDSRPNVLIDLFEANARGTNVFAHQDAWPHGSVEERMELMRYLHAKANWMGFTDRARGKEYARAALLLAAQDTVPLGHTQMSVMFRDPDFMQLAGLSSAQCARLDRMLKDHQTLSTAAVKLRTKMEIAIRKPAGPLPAEVPDAIHDLTVLGQYRMEVRYHLALICGRLRFKFGEPMNDLIGKASRELSDPHFDRWIREAEAACAAGRPPLGVGLVPSKPYTGIIRTNPTVRPRRGAATTRAMLPPATSATH